MTKKTTEKKYNKQLGYLAITLICITAISACNGKKSNQIDSDEPKILHPEINELANQTPQAPVNRQDYNNLKDAYLDLIMRDQTLSNLVQYARSNHVSSASCYDEKIPVCIAINLRLKKIDSTDLISAYDVLSANELDNADDNQVNKEAESLLKQYSDESDVRVK